MAVSYSISSRSVPIILLFSLLSSICLGAAVETPLAGQHTLAPRQDEPSPTAITILPSTVSLTMASGIGIVTANVATATSLPQPYDTGIGTNYTTSACPQFLRSFLADNTIQQCYPLSMLIDTSNGFFNAAKSFFRVTQVLDAVCQVNYQQCNKAMSTYANKLVANEYCGPDYRLHNPMVIQAYVGMVSYAPMYKAGCIKDHSGDYCYAKAMTNSTGSRMDTYPYFIPLGTSIPSDFKTSCSDCIQNTMRAFAETGGFFREQYTKAAGDINAHCGAQFVPTQIAISRASNQWLSPILITLACLITYVFVLR